MNGYWLKKAAAQAQKGRKNWKGPNFENRYKHIKLPEKIKCNICDVTKTVNDDNFGPKALFNARKGISVNGDEYREQLTDGSTPECYKCSVCSDRSRTEIECFSCKVWKDISQYSKQQRRVDPEIATCKKCVQEELDEPAIEDEDREREREQITAELAKKAAESLDDEDQDDDNDDAQTVTSDAATVAPSEFGVSSSVAGSGVSVASDTDSEIACSSEAASNYDNIADDGFIQVGSTKRNKFDPTKYRSNYGSNSGNSNQGNNGHQSNAWVNGFNAFDPTKYRSKKSIPAKRPSPWLKNRDIKKNNPYDVPKPTTPNLMDETSNWCWNGDKNWGKNDSNVGDNAITNWASTVPEVHQDIDSRW